MVGTFLPEPEIVRRRRSGLTAAAAELRKKFRVGLRPPPLHPKNIENHILMGFVRERKLPEGGLCLAMYFSYSQMYFQNCICLQRTQDGVKGNTL